MTDPWLFGPCFIAGWWHAYPPKQDALEIVNSADVLYISHNHPDHMHIEILLQVRKDLPILVPDFPSQSTVKPVREMGFSNVEALPFNSVYQVDGSPVHFSILQAGDFRDDSGLYVSAGDFSCLLAVDSNALNNFVLPQTVDLLMTAFAGGASGFPVCFVLCRMIGKIRWWPATRGLLRARLWNIFAMCSRSASCPMLGLSVRLQNATQL